MFWATKRIKAFVTKNQKKNCLFVYEVGETDREKRDRERKSEWVI